MKRVAFFISILMTLASCCWAIEIININKVKHYIKDHFAFMDIKDVHFGKNVIEIKVNKSSITEEDYVTIVLAVCKMLIDKAGWFSGQLNKIQVVDLKENLYIFTATPEDILYLSKLPLYKQPNFILSKTRKILSTEGKKEEVFEKLKKQYDLHEILDGIYEIKIINNSNLLTPLIALGILDAFCTSDLVYEELLSPKVTKIKIYSKNKEKVCIFYGGTEECYRISIMDVKERREFINKKLYCF
ncbi:hypothetical protein SAMN04488516_1175 [Desulfonauticus submarinus]|uniref:Uncharacterized protein n=1 Tax=Desulfonauticus submarinus TaxID=206665 RepID=A0A1H0G8K7_9BACT|nr:hypothetical protein [Desulfonauticus submarinus]SDO03212.1 hypothetical protein SAMN04488516_1175 [Desulfonauticus submarinus]